jgi:hypothetical protein
MISEIRYEKNIYKEVDFARPTIFLAGPTVRGHQTHLKSWRFEAVEIFKKHNFDGNLIIPEFTSLTESDKGKYELPLWEYHGLCNSHVILFWVPRTRELIGLTTNHEIGYWMARDRFKIVYGRPDHAYRYEYLDIMWEQDAKRYKSNKIEIHKTLEDTIINSIQLTKSFFKCQENDQELVQKWYCKNR